MNPHSRDTGQSKMTTAPVSVMPASSPKAATPSARSMACRSCSRCSCTSTIINSSRFSPMVNKRRVKRLADAASCPRVVVAGSIMGSVGVARAPAGDEIAGQGAHGKGDADGLIGMFVHSLIGGFGAFDRLVAHAAIELLAAFERGGETLAGFAHFFTRHVGRGGHQRPRIFGERAHVGGFCFGLFVHVVWWLQFVSIVQDGCLRKSLASSTSQ